MEESMMKEFFLEIRSYWTKGTTITETYVLEAEHQYESEQKANAQFEILCRQKWERQEHPFRGNRTGAEVRLIRSVGKENPQEEDFEFVVLRRCAQQPADGGGKHSPIQHVPSGPTGSSVPSRTAGLGLGPKKPR
jgi:hypothetical protein